VLIRCTVVTFDSRPLPWWFTTSSFSQGISTAVAPGALLNLRAFRMNNRHRCLARRGKFGWHLRSSAVCPDWSRPKHYNQQTKTGHFSSTFDTASEKKPNADLREAQAVEPKQANSRMLS